jgi:YegS/Rv2252/BmrU family lipid kinase
VREHETLCSLSRPSAARRIDRMSETKATSVHASSIHSGHSGHSEHSGSVGSAASDAPRRTEFHRALIVANPIAGRGRSRSAAREMAEGLARRGIECATYLTESRDDARVKLRGASPDVDLVVAIGGDGTVREVLEGLVNRDVPVAILPFGTANVMSLDLGLPRDVDRALEMIERGKTTKLDVARVNGRHLSFLVTGVGFDAMVVRELERRRKGAITKLDWGRAALRTIADYAPPSLAVEADGVRLEGEFGLVLVSNIVHFAGYRVLSRERRIDDGFFEAYLFEKSSKASLVGYALRGLLRGLPGGSCKLQRVKHILVTSPTPVPCHVDGDLCGTTPIEISVADVQFRLVIP